MTVRTRYTWADIKLTFDGCTTRRTSDTVEHHRVVTAAEAQTLIDAHPEWVHTFNTICEPPVSLWCDGDTPRLRAVHYDDRFGHHNETVYELVLP